VRGSAIVDDLDQGRVELLRWDRVRRFRHPPSDFVRLLLLGVAVGKVYVAFREMLAFFLCHVLVKTSKTRCPVDHENGLDVVLDVVLVKVVCAETLFSD
jgi:hypothetical protein